MAWQAELTQDLGIEYSTGTLVALVEFYDDTDRPGTRYVDSFRIKPSSGTVAEQRAELRKQVEERGKQIRALRAYALAMRAGIPAGATVPIP